MVYTLTLTKADRDAIDWVGDRYSGAACIHGAYQKLGVNVGSWDDEGDLTLIMPEHVAWGIQEGAEMDASGGHPTWPCFAPELKAKLDAFLDSIV